MTNPELISSVGAVTVVLSIAVKLIGFPDQFRKNRKRKSVEGVSKSFYVLSFVAYSVWTLYGALQKDIVVVLAQGLGVITTGAIVYQVFIYGRKSDAQ